MILIIKDSTILQRLGIDDIAVDADTERNRINEILANKDEYSWTVKCDGKIIGNVSLNGIKEASEKTGKRAGKVAIILGAEARGKVYSTRLRQEMIDWAFNEGGFEAIIGRIRPDNIPSIKMAERGGARLGEVEHREDGEWRYYIMYPKKSPQLGIDRLLDRAGKLSIWPTKGADKQLVCEWLATKIESSRTYSEVEFNDLIKSLHSFSDWPLLRRELIERGLVTRNRDGSAYRKA